MKKIFKITIVGALLFTKLLVVSAANFNYNGEMVFSSNIEVNGEAYISTEAGKSALVVSGGTSQMNACAIEKSGSSKSKSKEFEELGNNSAVVVYNGAILNFELGSIMTDADYANGIFAYGMGEINVENASINTILNNSAGIVAAEGAKINANGVVVETKGKYSPTIKSEKGAGKIEVNQGAYTSYEEGSANIYSKGEVIVNNATLTSHKSSSIEIIGANSVSLDNVFLFNENTSLQNVNNILIHGIDNNENPNGIAKFISKNSNINIKKGDTIYVNNIKADILLENNVFENNDGNFLIIKKDNSSENNNEVDVKLRLFDQDIDGNIEVGNNSSLDISIENGSTLIGAINSKNDSKEIYLTLSEDSYLSLTADTYVKELNNENTTNRNIFSNGKYKLFVNGVQVEINSNKYELLLLPETEVKEEKEIKNTSNIKVIALISSMITIIIIVLILIKCRVNRKNASND